MKESIKRFLRTSHLPHAWCPGCGNGIILNVFAHVCEKLHLDQDRTVIVSGIGCSGRITQYLNFDTIHTLHGRAIPIATGIKLSRPELNLIVFMGDGDSVAIGGNHLIHAARRNIDLTAIIINNMNYGMTGGQSSPTTPEQTKTKTSPYGSIEPTIDICQLAISAGATFVAKYTLYHVKELEKGMIDAITHKGFSLIEVISTCPVQWKMTPYHALKIQEKIKDRGILTKYNKPEFCEKIHYLSQLSQKQKTKNQI